MRSTGTSLVKLERSALADTLEQIGPYQPTLCTGWRTQDLLAHLVVRERRPDAAAGILIPFLAGYRSKIEHHFVEKDFNSLIGMFRSGPSSLSPFAIPAVDNLANLVEFVVHHEDVRRGGTDFAPRTNVEPLQEAILNRLVRMSSLFLRKAGMGVILQTPDKKQHWLKRGPSPIEMLAEPIEALLYLTGRSDHYQADKAKIVNVEFDGAPAALAAFGRIKFGL